jgi:hypothetical protein
MKWFGSDAQGITLPRAVAMTVIGLFVFITLFILFMECRYQLNSGVFTLYSSFMFAVATCMGCVFTPKIVSSFSNAYLRIRGGKHIDEDEI